jgi:hypothetical protein
VPYDEDQGQVFYVGHVQDIIFVPTPPAAAAAAAAGGALLDPLRLALCNLYLATVCESALGVSYLVNDLGQGKAKFPDFAVALSEIKETLVWCEEEPSGGRPKRPKPGMFLPFCNLSRSL